MKNLYLLLIGMLLFSNGFSQSVNWVPIGKVEELNRQNPKKIMVYFYADWCGVCKQMEREIFKDKAVISTLNKEFYAVKFNTETKEDVMFDGILYAFEKGLGSRGNHQLAIDMLQGQMAVPSIVFLDENQFSIRRLTGKQPKELFHKFLTYLYSNAYEHQDWFLYSGQKKE